MELVILSLLEAVRYVPQNRTYAIRISSEFSLDHLYKLVESDNWVAIASYVFDDVWPGMPGGLGDRDVVLSRSKAGSIISGFQEHMSGIETLLVQCQRGLNRSPAVGIALNEIFNLGYDTKWLKQQHPEFRKFVYDTMLGAAREMGLYRVPEQLNPS